MTDKSEEEHPFEEARRILKDAPDAIDFLVKHAKDANWDCVQEAHKILTDHFKKVDKMITMNSQRACINDTPLNNEDFYYISDGTWYVKGSLCWLEANCGEAGALMLGIRASDNQLDGELCSWDEFYIYDKNHVLVSEEEYWQEHYAEHVEGVDE